MDATADPMIRLDGVGKQYPDGTVAVHELTLEIGSGEVCCLVGPSGCGKTTTMRMINRLVEPSTGRIFIGGEDVTTMNPVTLRRQVGYVIQRIGLFPHITVRKNIATVPQLTGWTKRRIDSRVDDLLGLVGLDPKLADRYPHQLSGGQQQRVGVARALAADPPVLLMDEPFGAVDPIARDRLQDEFRKLQQALRKTVVFVTHDIDEAVRLGDRIAVLREGGHLEQYATPATLLAQPVSEFVADFVGSDRTLKRLAVTPIDGSTLEPIGRADSQLRTVEANESLRAALAILLDTPEGRVTVTRGVAEGLHPIGVLTIEGVHEALRADATARSTTKVPTP